MRTPETQKKRYQPPKVETEPVGFVPIIATGGGVRGPPQPDRPSGNPGK